MRSSASVPLFHIHSEPAILVIVKGVRMVSVVYYILRV